MSAVLAEVQAFVAEEARLLDDQDFDAWLKLFTPDCRYWVPVSPDMRAPTDGVAHFHDDLQLLMARTHRLRNPRAFGAEPSPRTAHVVSGVRVDREDGDELTATSSQIMVEWRDRGRFEADTRVFGGRVTHVLKRTPEGLRIRLKRVDLVNAAGAFNAMYAPL
jgi:3-phenylpropionate/cinnamic acid dioxygenase small subunit